MKHKLYLLEPGFNEDSVIYELKPREIVRLPRATVNEIEQELDRLQAVKIVVDAGYPSVIERLKLRRLVKKIFRRRLPNEL